MSPGLPADPKPPFCNNQPFLRHTLPTSTHPATSHLLQRSSRICCGFSQTVDTPEARQNYQQYPVWFVVKSALPFVPVYAMARQSAVILCVAAVILQLLLPAQAHMVMINPKSRQWLDYTLRYNYNPHAVNGGGVDVVSGGGKLQWPARNLGSICGDEPGQKKWISSGQVTGTYSSGSEITTDIVFAQNHLGRVFMSVCPLNAKSENECKALQRADGQGTSYELPWTRGWSGVSDGFTPTVEPITEFGVYKMKPYGKKEGCAAWACDQFKGMFVYSFKWKLPAGYKCEQCILMHYYLTASRCWPTCNGGNCKKPVIYANCGAPGATYPEEFWNCADIKIN